MCKTRYILIASHKPVQQQEEIEVLEVKMQVDKDDSLYNDEDIKSEYKPIEAEEVTALETECNDPSQKK